MYNKEDIFENLNSCIGTMCYWEGVKELRNFKFAVSPAGDVYVSKPGGEWDEEFVPESDWTIYEAETEEEAYDIIEREY